MGLVFLRRVLGHGYRVPDNPDYLPPLTLVVPAYNEIGCLEDKLLNSLSLDYPATRLRLLFVTEGSTDGTTELIKEWQRTEPRLEVIDGWQRWGKIEAINQAILRVTTPIVVFTDANTLLNRQALRNLVRHFENPQVGAVSGEKRIQALDSEAAAGSGEGLYWKYESFLKGLDTQLHTVVGAAGELFAVRTKLYERVERGILLDDFMISLRIAAQGYRVVYEPDAYALERPSFSISEEKKRKVRIAAGGFQAMERLKPLLNPFQYGWLSFQYVSHRVMRWAVTPLCLPLLLLFNSGLVLLPSDEGGLGWAVYAWALAAQVLFYGAAALGHWYENRQLRVKAFFVPYYFCFMNYCAFLGYRRYRRGQETGLWEKARRAF
ncbi:MAG: glycosyltransferase family 2 protein [Bacteroidetes bacterium]|nr:glycosyltransferase family 2 protein [Fibrella sp.]